MHGPPASPRHERALGASREGSLLLVEVSREFGPARRRVTALRPLSLRVGPGEAVALAGANGSGKTTALRIAAALVEPTGGRVLVCGRDAAREPAAARRDVGASFGSGRSFYWRLTARQNLMFFGRLAGLAGGELRERVQAVALELEVERFLDTPARRLSRGTLARLSVARALVRAPRVLLLDEPLASLDARGREAVARAVGGAAALGVAVLLTVQEGGDAGWCGRVHGLARR